MARKYFGTDGVRGLVGEAPITPDFVMKLGYAAGRVLVKHERTEGHTRPTVLIGKDTRLSGYLLESALEAGLIAAGVDTLLVGPLPTPAIAYLTRALRLDAGVVISASHNPFQDNGIKFFSGSGQKLSDAIELEIEAEIEAPMVIAQPERLGKAKRINDAPGRYIEFCKSTFHNSLNLRGVKLVVDCAHGATYQVAPAVFHELGAEVIAMGNTPDGININAGVGATHPEALQARVLAEKADYGIALDGDGDRLIVVDTEGQIYDGDRLLYVIAKVRQKEKRLHGGVVGTLMTNLGVEHAFNKLGIAFERAKVGDRYVLEKLVEKGWQVGGEGSGHILCLDQHTTGDGIVSALQVLDAIMSSKKSLAELCSDVTMYSQTLINVRVPKSFHFKESVPIQAAIIEAEVALKGKGRILIRASGTEPVLRVMTEGRDAAEMLEWAQKIAAIVEAESAK